MPRKPPVIPVLQKGEQKIHAAGTVLVTDKRVVFGSRAIVVSAITSVETVEIKADRSTAAALGCIGMLLLAASIWCACTSRWLLFAPCLLFGVLFLWLSERSKPPRQFAVRLSTASGEVDGYISTDRRAVQNIVDAINQVITA